MSGTFLEKTLVYSLTQSELRLWSKLVHGRRRALGNYRADTFTPFWIPLLALSGLIILAAKFDFIPPSAMAGTFVLAAFAMYLAVLMRYWRARKENSRAFSEATRNPLYTGKRSLTIDSFSINVVAPNLSWSIPRSSLTHISDIQSLVFIWSGTNGAANAIVVPHRAFASPAERSLFIEELTPRRT